MRAGCRCCEDLPLYFETMTGRSESYFPTSPVSLVKTSIQCPAEFVVGGRLNSTTKLGFTSEQDPPHPGLAGYSRCSAGKYYGRKQKRQSSTFNIRHVVYHHD